MPFTSPETRREYGRKWLAKRKADWFSDKICVDCGSTDHLELDHIKPEDKASHRIWSWSKERREVELRKCVARCKDCHAKKTSKDLSNLKSGKIYKIKISIELRVSKPLIHGTWSGYLDHGCRCRSCRRSLGFPRDHLSTIEPQSSNQSL